jgi:hypothetical protein
MMCEQGSFFWLQNTEGEPVVGGWLQIHQPEVLPPYFATRKKDLAPYTTTYMALQHIHMRDSSSVYANNCTIWI